MRINISYRKSLTFEQFKEQFEKHFVLSNPVRKEDEMKKAWERAEAIIKPNEEVVIVKPIKIEAVIAEDRVFGNDESISKRRDK